MRYAYFPGCSAESTARDMHVSTLAVIDTLGIDMTEPEGWICCGATAAHQTDRVLAAALPAASLLKVRDMDAEMIVNCAACYNRMKMANHEIINNPDIRKAVADSIGRDYDGSVRIRHLMEVFIEDIGLDKIKSLLKLSLNNMRIACYYGCLLVRPHDVTGFDDPENPRTIDNLVNAMGAEGIEWPHKTECCGGGLSLSRTDIVVSLTDSILAMARDCGAECIAVSCPMCQINLDLRQADIEKKYCKRYDMPILYVTQLLGLCLGIDAEKLGLGKLMVSAERIVKSVNPMV